MFEMKLPDPGEGLLEAEIVTWLVKPGDEVKVNDIVIEIETAKSLVELPAPEAGIVGALLANEGDTVPVGSVIMTILAPGESADAGGPLGPANTDAAAAVSAQPASEPTVGAPVSGAAGVFPAAHAAQPTASAPVAPAAPTAHAAPTAPTAQAAPSAPAAPAGSGSVLVGYGTASARVTRRPRKGGATMATPETDQVHDSYGLDEAPGHRVEEVYPTPAVTGEPQEPPLPRPEEGRPASTEVATDPVGRPLAKPAVRRLARDLGIDLGTVAGTGAGGLITPTDVAQAAAGEASGRKGPTRIPIRGVRRQMLHTMQASVQVPQASVWMDVDVTKTVELIDQLKARREFSGLRISPIVVLAKAVCLALAQHPEVNSTLDLARQEIIVHPDVNLGIAAATQRGLIVPNIKAANEHNILKLTHALNDLVAKVREGRITPSDAAHGTFTITNVGVFGVEGGTPILNPNESAILLLGTFNRRPWVVGTGEEERIEIRSVAKLTLTIDHRVLDGEQASRFLADVATILEDPGLSLLF
ncbi:MAG: dihydrolipoamide acetyltransferase family protein [Propioniciclava sp.]|uniref:dihydrolipoamide acetyltransferase family protein n=1 Tax=Propioniciclava sp. TaxID=2038686 RepID=UPI0039E69198